MTAVLYSALTEGRRGALPGLLVIEKVQYCIYLGRKLQVQSTTLVAVHFWGEVGSLQGGHGTVALAGRVGGGGR